MSPTPRPCATTARGARQGRIRALRRRVATLGATIFLAAWGIVFGQLVSGRDPGLARKVAPAAARSVQRSVRSSNGASAAIRRTAAEPSVTSDGATAAGATAPAPMPVVTRQS